MPPEPIMFTIICIKDYDCGVRTMFDAVTIKKGERLEVCFEHQYYDETDSSKDILDTDFFYHESFGYLPNNTEYFMTKDSYREFKINQII